ncbi:MAG: DinB family protein [Bacteroidota bacterium]|nr:DinB family protein [Bacteroidota bacterium]
MVRPDIEKVPAFYKGYVELVQDMDLLDALRHAAKLVQQTVPYIAEDQGEYRYAEGKWSVKEVLNHIMDAERVFAYRALRFARKDETPLHPFEENDYAPEANAHARSIQQHAREMKRLRETTIDLYLSFSPEMLEREGTASGKKLSVKNLGYIIAGHEIHHLNILRERYLNP